MKYLLKYALILLIAAGPAAAEDARLSAIRNLLAAARHPQPALMMAGARRIAADPQPYLRAISVETDSPAYVRMRALDLMGEFAGDAGALAFLEARVTDSAFLLRKYALNAMVRGFHRTHAVRVAATLQRCAKHDPDPAVRRLAASSIHQMRAGAVSGHAHQHHRHGH